MRRIEVFYSPLFYIKINRISENWKQILAIVHENLLPEQKDAIAAFCGGKVQEVKKMIEAFIMEYQIQQFIGFCEEEIDGYSGFIFSTDQGRLYRSSSVNDAIHRATNNT